MLLEAGEIRKEYPLDTITRQNHRVVDYERMGTRLAVVTNGDRKKMNGPGVYPPFTDLGRGLEGTKKDKVWSIAYELYREHAYEIVSAALKQVDLQDLLRNPSIKGETVASLEKLHNSFETVSRISRDSRVNIKDRLTINFQFLSKYATIDGKSIELLAPVMIRLSKGTDNWSVYRPEFIIGGEMK